MIRRAKVYAEKNNCSYFLKKKTGNLHCITKKIAIVAWASKRYLTRYKEIRAILWRENGAIIAQEWPRYKLTT